mmetsp:Transcript_21426/g.67265  ORF Transcript_21426/g.67265 Transcript_21426/m.67265 type:complete len:366 (-) Transcript_21426:39-1136(-)
MEPGKKARNKFYHQTSQQSYYMKPSDASVVKLEDTKVSLAAEVSAEERPRMGIVVMTKKPLDFEQWLAYHREMVGVSRFFVQCEDSPELAQLVCFPPWNECVEATFVAKTQRDYFVQMDRQATHIASVVPRARAAGIEWLLHIDDDELLYCPRGPGTLWAALRTAPPGVCDLHVQNVEALAPDASCEAPFASCATFIVSTSRFASYTNGKSFGRVARAGLRAHGPHHFRADGGESADLPPPCAVVLHYESCTFDRWSRKFRDLADRHGDDPDVVAKLPFPFYRESLAVMRKLAVAQEARAKLQQQGRNDDAAAQAVDNLRTYIPLAQRIANHPNLQRMAAEIAAEVAERAASRAIRLALFPLTSS